MKGYDRKTIGDLLEGALPWQQTKQIMSSYKDDDRFLKALAAHQMRVPWKARILLPLGENLYIVLKEGQRVVRCSCGFVFGDASRNWKLGAVVLVRKTRQELEEIYPHADVCDGNWMELREFICPSCATLLEVEACAPGYPIVEDFRPDLDAFYSEWLGAPLEDASGEASPNEHGGSSLSQPPDRNT
ncbi:MAG: acetone carboxylase subunit gamma [Rhodobacteraceae bacterium]|nr:acetone carboxylase subunit gamma [Paracoccaceae bacterium]